MFIYNVFLFSICLIVFQGLTIYHLHIEEEPANGLQIDAEQDDVTFLELKANEIITEIKKSFEEWVSSEELNQMLICFIGYSLNTALNNDFRVLRGERILLKQIVQYVR